MKKHKVLYKCCSLVDSGIYHLQGLKLIKCMAVVNLGFYGRLYHLKTNEPHLLSFPAARRYPYMSELLVAFLMTVYIKGWYPVPIAALQHFTNYMVSSCTIMQCN